MSGSASHPSHGDDDAHTFFDHLVAEGDLERVIGYLVRFRLTKRIEDLRRVGGPQIIDDLANGAEAYLQLWERAEAAATSD